MVHIMLRTNRTFTDEVYPFFEVVYVFEFIFTILFYFLAPMCFSMLWNAQPLHRNLRLSLCNLLLHGLLGTTARLVLVGNLYIGNGPLESRFSVIAASIGRCAMLEAYVGLFFPFAIERTIATFAWSWYEKASLQTIAVFVVLESGSTLWSWGWSTALIFQFVSTKQILVAAMCLAAIGCAIFLFIIVVNYRASIDLKIGARINQYSVARTFQIRENIVIVKALVKIGIRLLVISTPVFILFVYLNLVTGDDAAVKRLMARALLDLAISIYPFLLISYVPFSDVIFERSLKRMDIGKRLFNVFSIIHFRPQKRDKSTEKIGVNETDHYFSMFNASIKGPPIRRKESVKGSIMVHTMLRTNRTFTDEIFPLFEIIYAIEIAFTILFYFLAPVSLSMLWNARPLHRNLRLSMCNLVMQGLLGTTARLVLVYNLYVGSDPLETRPSVIVASILRCSMLEAFVGVFFSFAVERLVATFAWSWYEKASKSTIIVFIILECTTVMWSWTWSTALTFEFVSPTYVIIAAAGFAIVGSVIGLFLIVVNYRASMEMKIGARINQYSVAKSFQIRENVVITKAIVKIGTRVMVLNVPVFALLAYLNLVSGEDGNTERLVSRAILDLAISMYPAAIISYIPFSDAIFERSLKRMDIGSRLFDIFAIIHCRARNKISPKIVINEADHYFDMLNTSLNGPPA